MAKVRCHATCYMPTGKTGKTQPKWARYEDWFQSDGDVYDIPGKRLQEFLDTGNFERVKGD